MIRRPPRSTLFPTRRSSDLPLQFVERNYLDLSRAIESIADRSHAQKPRSEEHTSELQSLAYLVCRLLLEKKKQNIQLQPIRRPTETSVLLTNDNYFYSTHNI